MRRISSRMTYFNKRIVPIIWFGFVVVFLLGFARDQRTMIPGLLICIVMFGFMFLIFKKLIFDLCDEAWDDGAALVVRKKGYEVRIPLVAIVNLSHDRWANPQRVTLLLREDTPLGKEISFALPARLLPLGRSPIVDELIPRIDEARRRAPDARGEVTWTEL